MRKFLTIIASCLIINAINAQLPNGSIAPDFTLTDIYGKTHNLYSYLNDGKTVYLDFFATWCPPCWSHHQSGSLEDLYQSYGPNGTDEIMVIMIEGDTRTNVNCISGSSGCNNNTQGDWTAGTNFPIADNASVRQLYQVGYYPTIYGICPDKIVTELGQRSSSQYYDWHQNNCALTVNLVEKKDVLCHGNMTGSVEVVADGGTGNYSFTWSNGMAGEKIQGVSADFYYVTLSDGPTQVVGGPYEVSQPPLLEIVNVEVEDSDCENVSTGSIFLDVIGGVEPYDFDWRDGDFDEFRNNLPIGLYDCQITDANNCKVFTGDIEVKGKPVPQARASADTSVCAGEQIRLGVSAGMDYEWSDGSNEQFPLVKPLFSDFVYVSVTYSTGCVSVDSVFVEVNELPVLGDDQVLEFECGKEFMTLEVPTGPNSNYLFEWRALDGGTILGDKDRYTVDISTTGSYELMAVNEQTGCSNSITLQVDPDDDLPVIEVDQIGEIDCISDRVILDATSSSNGEGYNFSWTALNPEHEILNGQSLEPTVTQVGEYTLRITNLSENCENSRTILVEPGVLKRPDVSIGFNQVDEQIEFYNASAYPAESIQWFAPDGSESYGEKLVLNNADLGEQVRICLAADNKCGEREKTCQTIDLLDQSYYLSGRTRDQFGEELEGVLLNYDQKTTFTDIQGIYFLENLALNSSFELYPQIPIYYQIEDITESDLSELWQKILLDQDFGDPVLNEAADINRDGRLSLLDVVLFKQYLLTGNNSELFQEWISTTSECLDHHGSSFVNECSRSLEVTLLQASRLNHDFVLIQRGDLTDRDHLTQNGKTESIIYDRDHFEFDLSDPYIFSLNIQNVPSFREIRINGQILDANDYVYDGHDLKVLSLLTQPTEKLELDFIRDRQNIQNFGSNKDLESMIQLGPNPAQNHFNMVINVDRNQKAQWNMYNHMGQIVLQKNIVLEKGQNEYFQGTNNLIDGVYWIKVESTYFEFQDKLIITKN